MIYELLERLKQAPATTAGLALAVGSPQEVVEAALEQLRERGYVAQAYEGADACSSGCGSCSVQRLCPTSGQSQPATAVWRVTERIPIRLQRPAG